MELIQIPYLLAVHSLLLAVGLGSWRFGSLMQSGLELLSLLGSPYGCSFSSTTTFLCVNFLMTALLILIDVVVSHGTGVGVPT